MDAQAAIELVAGATNLTDHLDEQAAAWLRDWAAGQIPSLLEGIADDGVVQARVSALMAVMRKLNQITANRLLKTPDALAEDVRVFLFMYGNLFALDHEPRSGKVHHVVKAITQLSSLDALAYLIDFAGKYREHEE